MNSKIKKIASYTAFGLTMAVLGVVITGFVSAQVLNLNCTSTSSGFSGWIACNIGLSSQGISGADTLFKGQKALSDKIAAIPGGSSGSDGGSQVYLERKNASGNTESMLLGTVANFFQQTLDAVGFWGCKITTASPGLNMPPPPVSPDRILGTECPGGTATEFTDDRALVVFAPSTTKLQEYTIRNGIKPTLCYVEERHESNLANVRDGMAPTNKVRVYCTYAPTMCQYGVSLLNPPASLAYKNCATMAERSKLFYNYETTSASTPQDQRYRIVIK